MDKINVNEIYNNLKHNAHGNSFCENNLIIFGFNSLDNLIIMMIESKQYTDNINVVYDEHSTIYPYKLKLKL